MAQENLDLMNFIKQRGEQKMKEVVRLALVLITLLVVTNVAFAQPCTNEQDFCYSVTVTDQYGTTFNETWFAALCNEGYGILHGYEVNFTDDLYLFGGGPGWFNTNGNPMLGGNPFWTSWIFDSGEGAAGYLQPQGTGGLLLTGEGHIDSTRFTLKGKKIPLSNCPEFIMTEE
jgi:hypothetical protein